MVVIALKPISESSFRQQIDSPVRRRFRREVNGSLKSTSCDGLGQTRANWKRLKVSIRTHTCISCPLLQPRPQFTSPMWDNIKCGLPNQSNLQTDNAS